MKQKQKVLVNQLGYSLNEVKYAYISSIYVPSDETFIIYNSKRGEEVFRGKLKRLPTDELSGDEYFLLDFSEFNEKGNYIISVGNAQSFVFPIGNKVYNDVFHSALQYFSYSRCGQEVEAGKWSHPACHTEKALIYGTTETKDVNGGWHDAGDYGRYIVAGSKAVMDLLLTYEQIKDTYSDFDILAEARYELEWMLKLQREDGAVYHKVSCYRFCGFIAPHEETESLVIAPVSTSATADFAGCLAFASKFYQEKDANFAQRLLESAIKAQTYLDTHEDELYKNPQEITTGGYGDWNVSDERYFALCSLFAATGKKEYLENSLEIKQKALSKPEDKEHPWMKNWIEAFGWGCVAGYGSEILLRNEKMVKEAIGTEEIESIKQAILSRAEKILEQSNSNVFGYDCRFVQWGSNGCICDEAHILLLAYDICEKEEYKGAARRQIDYILGCNPVGICYITGFGHYKTEAPHHRPSGAVGRAMPGMLAGGPSAGLQDAVAKENLEGRAPLNCYIDHEGSYSTNEVAIYWNSTFVYLLSRLTIK